MNEPVTKSAAHLKALESAGGRHSPSVQEAVAHSTTDFHVDAARARILKRQIIEFFRDPENARRFEEWRAKRGAA